MGASSGGATAVPNLSADAFAAADAANLASQGIGAGQMEGILGQAGAPDAGFLAADASQLAGQGLSQAAIEQNLNPAGMPTSATQAKPFDFQGLAKDLGEVSKEQAAQKTSMTPVNTQAAGAGQGGLPNFYANLGAGQAGMSGAMQAIQQGQMSAQPMGLFGAMMQPKGR